MEIHQPHHLSVSSQATVQVVHTLTSKHDYVHLVALQATTSITVPELASNSVQMVNTAHPQGIAWFPAVVLQANTQTT